MPAGRRRPTWPLIRRHLKAVAALLLAAALLPGCAPATTGGQSPSDAALDAAYRTQRSGIQVTGSGRVVRILADDNDGGRHQRFVVERASGQTLLIAHNIDVAPRVDDLAIGDTVEFHGVYEWNDEGGVVHWTHHDPQGAHEAGWLKHKGSTYQ